MNSKLLSFALVLLASPPVVAQGGGATQERLDRALQAVLDAEQEDLGGALGKYFRAQIATNALYAGQHAGLSQRKDVVLPLLEEWVLEAPDEFLSNEDGFRQHCIRATRDIVGKQAPETLLSTLKQIVDDSLETDALRTTAGYALYQFGETKAVDELVEKFRAATESEDANRQGGAWFQLADLYYGVGEYAKSAESYTKVLGLQESGAIDLQRFGLSVPTVYYNYACTLSLSDQVDEALTALAKAMKAAKQRPGALPRALLETDRDIERLRQDPRFAELVSEFFGTGEARAKKADKDHSPGRDGSAPGKS